MQDIAKVFKLNGQALEDAVNSFMDEWADDNLGHLTVEGVSALDIQKIGGAETQIFVTFRRHAASSLELDLLERDM